jgi:hypothetical protein
MHDVLSEKLTLVSLNISLFSCFRRATREIIADLGGSLPASNAITEGSIKIFPCDGTKELLAVRRGLFRKLQSKGVRALGSQNVFAVLTGELPEIEREIARAESLFEAACDDLRLKYDRLFEEHVSSNPEAETTIRSLKMPMDVALSKCRFSTDVFRIAPFLREGQSNEEGVEGIVRGLGRKLYEELAEDMEKLLKHEAFEQRRRVGQKTMRPLRAQLVKLKKLAFLDPAVDGAIQLVTETLEQLPAEGYIEGQAFQMLEKLVEVMSDPDTLLNAASKVKNGIPPCDVLFPPASCKGSELTSIVAGELGVTSKKVLTPVPVPDIPCPNLGIPPSLPAVAGPGIPLARDKAGKPMLIF